MGQIVGAVQKIVDGFGSLEKAGHEIHPIRSLILCLSSDLYKAQQSDSASLLWPLSILFMNRP